MGTYNNTEKEIVIELTEKLNDIEGDFNRSNLIKALDILKEYPYVADEDCKTFGMDDGKWEKMLEDFEK